PQGQLGLGASYFAANRRQDGSAILKQAFVRFKGFAGDKPSSLRVGRFEFADGTEVVPADATLATLKRDHIAHRLIGPFTFTHVGRSFDGLHYVRNTKAYNLTFVGARPTEGVFQLRGNKELDVDFYYGALTKPLPGKHAQSEARAFALHYHDGRGALKTDNRPLPLRRADARNIRLTMIGGHYISALKTGSGTTDVLLWGVGQFGRWGVQDHRAGAFAAEAGYQFKSGIKPWVRVGYFRSTGDDNPNDNDHNTFFQVLPTPRIYARFPYYNLMNNEDVFAQLRLKPHTRLSLRTDVHFLQLSNRRDLWYVGGGAFQEGTFGYVGRPSGGTRGMGTLFDLSADYNLAQKTALTFYVGGARGGGVQGNVYPEGGPRPTARYLYLELIQRF
ncbi:MAG TPA: alginate export family protein, partial [Abditibacteriaceae bacterium]|nr:alginate export family protein [Abditibacteriaceae bacterium]